MKKSFNLITILCFSIFLLLYSCNSDDTVDQEEQLQEQEEQEEQENQEDYSFSAHTITTNTETSNIVSENTSFFDDQGRLVLREYIGGNSKVVVEFEGNTKTVTSYSSTNVVSQVEVVTYDSLGRLISNSTDFGLTSEQPYSINISLTYNEDNIACVREYVSNGNSTYKTHEFQLNSNGNISEVAYSDGTKYIYLYNANDDLSSIRIDSNSNNDYTLFEFSYLDELNGLRQVLNPSVDIKTSRNNIIAKYRGAEFVHPILTTFLDLSNYALDEVTSVNSTTEPLSYTQYSTGNVSYVYNENNIIHSYKIENVKSYFGPLTIDNIFEY